MSGLLASSMFLILWTLTYIGNRGSFVNAGVLDDILKDRDARVPKIPTSARGPSGPKGLSMPVATSGQSGVTWSKGGDASRGSSSSPKTKGDAPPGAPTLPTMILFNTVKPDDFVYDMGHFVPDPDAGMDTINNADGDSLSLSEAPMQVHIGMYIQSIGDFRLKEMTFQVDAFFRMSWVDPTMVHSGQKPEKIRDKISLSKIWVPDLYFPNAPTAKLHDVTSPNFALYIEPNGTVSYSLRTTLEVSCNMKLYYYPMDNQTCSIQIMSYGNDQSAMNVSWFSNDPIVRNDEIELPQFEIVEVSASYCSANYRYSVTEYGHREGEFSCLLARIYLQRSMGFHLLQTYIPTGLIVVISWVSFWIDRNAVPARVTLSFTTLLTMFTQGASIRYSLPSVSYSKAIDYWFGTCVLFVFAALLEFTFVNSLMRSSTRYMDIASDDHYKRWQRKRSMRSVKHSSIKQLIHDEEDGLSESMKMTLLDWSAMHSQKALYIDQTSRILFPTLFGLFCAVYWTFYLGLFAGY